MTSQRALRIVTINTGKGDGPYRARIEALTAGLRDLEPDLVLCQEAFTSVDGSMSTAHAVARGLDLEVADMLLRRKERAVEGQRTESYSALATLSRFPIVDVEHLPLPDDPTDGQRAVMFAVVEMPGGHLIRIANTHLTHLRHRADLRLLQMRAVLAHEQWRRDAAACLLAGDLNARPQEDVHALLRGEEYGLPAVDVFAAANISASATIRHEGPSGPVEARVDYIYLLPASGGRYPAALDARVVLDRPIGGVLPSDHFGVLADVRL